MDLSYQPTLIDEIRKILEGNFGVKKSFLSFAQKSEETDLELREYIITESDKLFCQHGFKSVTMDDIAKHLGISKKTIYQHFKDKNELVNILITDKLDNQVCVMEDQRKAENAVHEIYISIETINNSLTEMNPNLFYDLQKYHPEAWLKFRAFREKCITKSIAENLERGISEGIYRTDLNKNIITLMRLDQLDMIFTQKNEVINSGHSINQIMAEVTEHFLHGIVNEKGLELYNNYKQTRKTNHNYA